MSDIKEEVSRAVKTGKVVLGSKKTIKSLLTGNPKLIVVSDSCTNELKDRLSYYSTLAGIPCKTVEGTTLELGSLCGKPYTVSALAVLDAGKSKLLDKKSR